MKKILLIVLAFAFVASANAQTIFDGQITVNNFSMTRNGDFMFVEMDLDMSAFNVSNNRVEIYTPVIINGENEKELYSIGIYGRRRYFTYVRNGWSILGNENDVVMRESECPDVIKYKTNVPYQEWMNGANIRICNNRYGCCNKLVNEQFADLAGYEHFIYNPQYLYVKPQAETEKQRELSGSAFVDFPVSQTVIYPEYRNNVAELQKIIGTIDSVRNDSDITITSIFIKGFASPESPYSNNTRLAKGRTEALRQYVKNLYQFPDNIITTAYEPENWEGLRAYVEKSNITNKENILQIIDCNREPDNKEWYLKTSYPAEYRFLLQNCYPALRRSDYKVEYIIRSFSDPKDILQIMRTAPQKLSLQEFYVGAQALELGSEDFCDLFGIAVLMYPNDEIANLNAANAAMTKGDMRNAERYLAKAGNSNEAIYARGVFAALNGNCADASELFNAVKENIPQAVDALEQIKKLD